LTRVCRDKEVAQSEVEERRLSVTVESEDVRRLYRAMKRIRHVEEEIARLYPSDKIKSPVHLSIGQESVAVGICDPLKADDVVSGTYRGHAAYLAKGGSLPALMAELYGKVDGCAAGKGGSMHIIDMEHFILGTSAVVGSTIPVAVGYALAMKREGRGRVVACFFGDGATEEGVFAESVNFAALKHLPVLFVCENNQYAIHTHTSRRWASDQLCARVATYGIPAEQVTDGDVLAIRERAAKAYAVMRDDGGPAFIECRTYRWREHVGPGEDYDAGYRRRAELEEWQRRDQIARLGAMLAPAERGAIDAAIEAEVAAAVDFAEKSPFPPIEQLKTDVFA
jgi:TPP-dependent pyruvate/acetoin dehydrogenase alpha subunit